MVWDCGDVARLVSGIRRRDDQTAYSERTICLLMNIKRSCYCGKSVTDSGPSARGESWPKLR